MRLNSLNPTYSCSICQFWHKGLCYHEPDSWIPYIGGKTEEDCSCPYHLLVEDYGILPTESAIGWMKRIGGVIED